jgi:hypothetical protein
MHVVVLEAERTMCFLDGAQVRVLKSPMLEQLEDGEILQVDTDLETLHTFIEYANAKTCGSAPAECAFFDGLTAIRRSRLTSIAKILRCQTLMADLAAHQSSSIETTFVQSFRAKLKLK